MTNGMAVRTDTAVSAVSHESERSASPQKDAEADKGRLNTFLQLCFWPESLTNLTKIWTLICKVRFLFVQRYIVMLYIYCDHFPNKQIQFQTHNRAVLRHSSHKRGTGIAQWLERGTSD